MAIEFGLNNRILAQIDTTPEGATRTWVRVAKGVSSLTPATAETLDETAYLDDAGGVSPTVTGKAKSFAAAGHRVFGDVAQDYIFSKIAAMGSDLETNFRIYDQTGRVQTCVVVMTDLVEGGGDAANKSDISFTLRVKGAPPVPVNGAAAPALTATVAPGTVAGNTSFTATAGVGNTLGYKLAAAADAPNANSYPGLLVAYTSGANIPAVVGQVLNMYELDVYGRVVKFAQDTLASGDFPV